MLDYGSTSTVLYVAKDKSGSLHEAFAELSKFITGSVDQGVCHFLHELYITQVIDMACSSLQPQTPHHLPLHHTP